MNYKVTQTSLNKSTDSTLNGLQIIEYYEITEQFSCCFGYFSCMKNSLLLHVLILILTTSIHSQSNKINGVSFVSPPKVIGSTEIAQPNQLVHANYLSLMPYGFIPEGSTNLKYNTEWQWWGEKTEGAITMIELAKKEGYKIMLKPHVWIKHGTFTGHHTYSNSKEWEAFEVSYSKYILDFTRLAEKHQVELFCIGTEWGKFVEERPLYWKRLIKEVRKVYSGKLTYAANWDEYSKVPFWKELDYIGVDAYFPLAQEKTPTAAQLKYALLEPLHQLRIISTSNNKPILFTEFGYRSIDFTTKKPWESGREGVVNLQGQINAYEAFFECFWQQEFIAGGFIWKWFANHSNAGGESNNGFTPQNKPVERVIKNWYSLK